MGDIQSNELCPLVDIPKRPSSHWSLSLMALTKIAEYISNGILSEKMLSTYFKIPPPLPRPLICDILRLLQVQCLPQCPTGEMLLPLICTGAITRLDLYVSMFEADQLSQTLRDLKQQAQKFKILTLWYENPYPFNFHRYLNSDLGESLADLLSSATSLERLSTNISFDITVLRSLKKLKDLELHFMIDDIRKSTDTNKLFQSLQKISTRIDIPTEDTMFLLENLPNLNILSNISVDKALDAIHSKQLSLGNQPAKKFQLKSVELKGVSLRILNILQETCPKVEHVNFSLSDYDITLFDAEKMKNQLSNYYLGILYYSDTSQLGSIIKWFMKSLGFRIKKFNIFNVDMTEEKFELVGKQCKHLETLQAFLMPSNQSFVFSDRDKNQRNLFPNLLDLNVICTTNGSVVSSSILYMLLSGCERLKKLKLFNVAVLNDELLDKILSSNSMTHLTHLDLRHCSITDTGLKHLLSTAFNLRELNLSSSAMSESAVKNTTYSMNPFILVQHTIT